MFFYGIDFYIGLSLVRKMKASLCVPSRKVFTTEAGAYVTVGKVGGTGVRGTAPQIQGC